VKQLALLLLATVACETPPVSPTPAWVTDTHGFAPNTTQTGAIADRYRGTALKIIEAARKDRGAYDKLSTLTDTIGHRLAGSPELDRAIAWAAQAMKDDGLTVRTEKVMVPHWVRGVEEGSIVQPTARALHLLGLGGSVSTPKGGVTAPLVVVHDWNELEAKKESVKGAIVLFDVPMPAYTDKDGPGYGKVVGYRGGGASAAAKLGAVGMLMRSVTARSLSTPHTGAMGYADGVPKIAAAAVTVEDAELLDRLAKRGPVTVHLRMEDQQLPDVESANVIGELVGKDKPDEIVVIGGHIDSWDVGQGANDDGAGIVTMMETLRVLKQLGLQPRRTIRAVLFVNEENGTRGAKAYAHDHEAELPKTVLALESDTGGFEPHGFFVAHKDKDASARMLRRIADIATLLGPIGATRAQESHGGTDIEPMEPAGVPQIGLWVDMRTYFDYHHTDADTLDKVDPQQLADDVAAVAVLAYVVADMPDRVDAP
jgi:carboxypeptidase Q